MKTQILLACSPDSTQPFVVKEGEVERRFESGKWEIIADAVRNETCIEYGTTMLLINGEVCFSGDRNTFSVERGNGGITELQITAAPLPEEEARIQQARERIAGKLRVVREQEAEHQRNAPALTPPRYDQEYFDAMDLLEEIDRKTDYDPDGSYPKWLVEQSTRGLL